MDTRFSVAVHLLVLVSESPEQMTSEQMARSVGTNASYVRRVLASLGHAGVVRSRGGSRGYELAVPADELTLLRVYRAACGEGHLLDIHQNPSDECVVGRHIRPVLKGMFAEAEDAFVRALGDRTLADCVADIRKRLDEEDG